MEINKFPIKFENFYIYIFKFLVKYFQFILHQASLFFQQAPGHQQPYRHQHALVAH